MENEIPVMNVEELKSLLRDFFVEESYGGGNVAEWVSVHGTVFKPRASDKEIEDRVNFFLFRKFGIKLEPRKNKQ